MELLFISNFYPPLHRGGYEEWCYEVAGGLRERGHNVTILTSRHRRQEVNGDERAWVLRDLYLEMAFASLRNSIDFFVSSQRRERENLNRLRELVEELAPDAIVIWGMWNLSRSLAALAEKLCPNGVVYYLGDYWPTLPSQHLTYWESPPKSALTAAPKFFLKWPARRMIEREPDVSLQFSRALFCSRFLHESLKREGISFGEARIIYGAIDVSQYLDVEASNRTPEYEAPLTLLYVGRLHPDKGVHTAVEAVGYLARERGLQDLRLLVAGEEDADYIAQLHDLVRNYEISFAVEFLGPVPKRKMPEVYRGADILIFPSIWDEPFGRTLVEAMASGLAVVASSTGGAAEIVVDEKNALIFDAGDHYALARQIYRLWRFPKLREQLAMNGRQTAAEKFDLPRMVDEIEDCLEAFVLE